MILVWTDVLPSDPAKSCPPTEPTDHASLSPSEYPRHYLQPCHTSRLAPSGMSSRRSCSKRDRHPYAKHPSTHATHHLIELLDTNHVQILGPQTHSLQDKEAPKVRREEGLEACRADACIVTTTASAESRRSHRLLHAEDIRSGVGNMPTI